MKFRSRSFLLLAAVALLFFAGASIYVNAQFGAVDLAGEVLAGERSAAEGITVHERDVLYSRVEFSASYDAGSGETVSRGGILPRTEPAQDDYPAGQMLRAKAAGLYGHAEWEGPEPDLSGLAPWAQDIFDDAVAGFDGGTGRFSGPVLLNAYTGTLTARLHDQSGLQLTNSDGGAEAALPLACDVWLDVTVELTESGGSMSFSPGEDLEYSACTSFTYAGDRAYFTLCLTGPEPGGSGTLDIYALDCDSSGYESDPDSYPLTADFSTLERLCSVEAEWESALLGVDADGRLLLFTTCAGELWLRVIDPAAGALTQCTYLSDEAGSGYSTFTALDGCVVLEWGHSLNAAALNSAGMYEGVCAVDTASLPEPEGACAGSNAFLHFTREMCAWDGHRLAILDYGDWLPDHGMRYQYYSRLSVYEDGELVFCEWLPALLRQQPFAERALTLSAEPREVTP